MHLGVVQCTLQCDPRSPAPPPGGGAEEERMCTGKTGRSRLDGPGRCDTKFIFVTN